MVDWLLVSNDYRLWIFFGIMAVLGLLLSIGRLLRSRDARGLKDIANIVVHGLVLVWTSIFIVVGMMLFVDLLELMQYWEGKLESDAAKFYITRIIPLWYIVTLVVLAVTFGWFGMRFRFLKYNEREQVMEEEDGRRGRARLRRILSFVRREK